MRIFEVIGLGQENHLLCCVNTMFFVIGMLDLSIDIDMSSLPCNWGAKCSDCPFDQSFRGEK